MRLILSNGFTLLLCKFPIKCHSISSGSCKAQTITTEIKPIFDSFNTNELSKLEREAKHKPEELSQRFLGRNSRRNSGGRRRTPGGGRRPASSCSPPPLGSPRPDAPIFRLPAGRGGALNGAQWLRHHR